MSARDTDLRRARALLCHHELSGAERTIVEAIRHALEDDREITRIERGFLSRLYVERQFAAL